MIKSDRSTGATSLASWRHVLRSRIWQSPAVYLPLARRRYPGPSPAVIADNTELVIEGYMRSANTYAVHAFQFAQRRPVRLAHHLHAPAQLIEAARRGLPALVLIRDPEGTILSQVQWEPGVSMAAALSSYRRFYRTLEPYADRFVVGSFADVTGDFGGVVRRLNARFGTDFEAFEATDRNERLCFELMQERASENSEWRSLVLGYESGDVPLAQLLRERSRFPSPAAPEGGTVWSPSSERGRNKDILRARWNDPDLARPRRDAEAAYRSFMTAAASASSA